MNIYGLRKYAFAIGAFLIIAFVMFAGAIPCFAYLQSFIRDVLDTLIWITGLYMGGNVLAKTPDGLNKLITSIRKNDTADK